jgi:glycosyltransferase involved in cell wall biosynthesis
MPFARLDGRAVGAPQAEARSRPGPLLHINGRFLTQPVTGVQRYAECLLRALDEGWRLAPPRHLAGAVLWVPPATKASALTGWRYLQVRRGGPRWSHAHVWEQTVLPWLAREGWLLSLAGSAPWLGMARQMLTMHDAAVFENAAVYSSAFVGWYRALFAHASRHAGAVNTVSQDAGQRLRVHLPGVTDKLRVIPNGGDHLLSVPADGSVLQRLGLQPGRYWLSVGAASVSKNLGLVRQALAELAHSHPGEALPWVVVGDTHQAAFRAGSIRAGAGTHEVLAGRVDDAELRALYSGATALVVASGYEGFGLPVAEAMSLGCPVVAARIGALQEVAGDAACWFTPGDPQSLRLGLRSLRVEPGQRERLVRAGLARARQWSWAGSAALLAEALDRLAAGVAQNPGGP